MALSCRNVYWIRVNEKYVLLQMPNLHLPGLVLLSFFIENLSLAVIPDIIISFTESNREEVVST